MSVFRQKLDSCLLLTSLMARLHCQNMSKPYFCKNEIVNSKTGEITICSQTDPVAFETNRKSICKECRKLVNRISNKEKAKKVKEINKLEQKEEEIKQEEIKTRTLKTEIEIGTENSIVNLIKEVLNSHILIDKKYSIVAKIYEIDNFVSESVIEFQDKIVALNQEIFELKKKLKF